MDAGSGDKPLLDTLPSMPVTRMHACRVCIRSRHFRVQSAAESLSKEELIGYNVIAVIVGAFYDPG